jgi:2-polyprenyl-3-methyl-5-hydroxy-6-metoxy-1,4-benzoquinol methylase
VKYEYGFDPDAENNTAASIYALARRGGKRVLDIGSGPGIVSSALARADNCTVTCMDADAEALEAATAAGAHRVICADLDAEDWYAELGNEAFDTVILADVLEHLRDPARLLSDLRERDLLDPAATVVISVPNANHQAVLAELFSGDFRYTDTGLLDSTHIRWFTLDSMTRLLESTGFLVTEVRRTLRTLEQTTHSFRGIGLSDAARQAITDLGVEGRTYQYVLMARPTTHDGRLAELHERVQAALQQADASDKAVRIIGRKLGETQALLASERRHMLQEAATGAAELTAREKELAAAKQELKRANRRLRKTEQQLATVRKSGPSVQLPRRVAALAGGRGRYAVAAARRLKRKAGRVLAARRSDAT